MMALSCGPRYLRGLGRRIAWVWEIKAAVSYDWASVLQSAERDPVSEKKKQTKNKLINWCMHLFIIPGTADTEIKT